MNDDITEEELLRRRRKNGMKRGHVTGEPYAPDDLFDNTKIDSGNMGSDVAGKTPSTKKAGEAAAKQAISGGSGVDIGSSALMATGNPYAMAAGAGLAVLSGARKRAESEHETRQILKQKRLERQQNAINKMIEVSRGLSNL